MRELLFIHIHRFRIVNTDHRILGWAYYYHIIMSRMLVVIINPWKKSVDKQIKNINSVVFITNNNLIRYVIRNGRRRRITATDGRGRRGHSGVWTIIINNNNITLIHISTLRTHLSYKNHNDGRGLSSGVITFVVTYSVHCLYRYILYTEGIGTVCSKMIYFTGSRVK